MASSPATPSAGAKNILRCDSAALENICRDYFRLKEDSVDSLLSIVGRSNHHGFAAGDVSHAEKFRQLEAKCRRFNGISIMDHADMVDLHYVFLEPFACLREVHLYMCPPSTVVDLYQFRDRLEVLEMVNSGITDISDVLAPIRDEYLTVFKPRAVTRADVITPLPPQQYYWDKLNQLRLSNCGIVGIDETFHLMPRLEILDLSQNAIGRIVHLQDCFCLRSLNISNNQINSLKHCGRVLGNLKSLDLSGNLLVSLTGLEKLIALVNVNLAHNLIEDYRQLDTICKLPFLESFALMGNPISAFPEYRFLVFQYLLTQGSVLQGDRDIPRLDGHAMTAREVGILRNVMFRSLQTDDDSFVSHRQGGRQIENMEDDGDGIGHIDSDAFYADEIDSERAMPVGLPDHMLGMVRSGAYLDADSGFKKQVPTTSGSANGIGSYNNEEADEDVSGEGAGLWESLKALQEEWWSILSGSAYEQADPNSSTNPNARTASIVSPSSAALSAWKPAPAFAREDSWTMSRSDSLASIPAMMSAHAYGNPSTSVAMGSNTALTNALVYEANRATLGCVLKANKHWQRRLTRKHQLQKASRVNIQTALSSFAPGQSSGKDVHAFARKKQANIDVNELICNHSFHSYPDLDIVKRTRLDARVAAKQFAMQEKVRQFERQKQRIDAESEAEHSDVDGDNVDAIKQSRRMATRITGTEVPVVCAGFDSAIIVISKTLLVCRWVYLKERMLNSAL
jgi:hypothetical protein